jgi:site-specific recombinase XerD
MLSAMLRLIELTVDDGQRARALKEQILDGLYPRPNQRRAWNIVPRTVGGTKLVLRRRPVLSLADVTEIVAAASVASPNEEAARRDRAVVALACWSGISPYELPTLRWEQLHWLEPTDDAPWCAMIHGIARRMRQVCIPVAEDAGPYLRELFRAASSDEKPASGHIFVRCARGKGRPLTYSMTRRIVRLAVQHAGLPSCDDTTLKRAYAAHLKQRGVNDYAIRDALGLKSMASFDGLLRRHRSAAAQRVAAEHHVIEAPHPPVPETPWRQLALDPEPTMRDD